MRNDKIRFYRIVFDWFAETVYIKYAVGTQAQGGYEEEATITFEKFTELIDTEKLRNYLFISQ